MNVFKSDILEKQINNNSNRQELIRRFNKIVEKLFRYKSISDLEKDKDLGFKNFKGKNYNVFGIDFGTHNSSKMAGERLIVSFIEKYSVEEAMFREINDDNNEISILLHFYCKHDEQNKKSSLVDENYILNHGFIPIEKAFTKEELVNIDEGLHYKNKYQKLVYSDFEKPTVTVLTMDKYDVINNFLFEGKATILTGIAGSGKTEIIINLMKKITSLMDDKKILYLTYSENLVNAVSDKCKTFNTDNIEFHSLKSLVRSIMIKDKKDKNKNQKEFENIKIFSKFIKEILSKNIVIDVDYKLVNKLIKFVNDKNIYTLYSEIYGLITGTMLKDWNRTSVDLISFDEYKELTKDYKLFNDDELYYVYEIAKLYLSYIKSNNYLSFNIEVMKIINEDINDKYDYVLVDEVQDLTECQIKMLFNLAKSKNQILLCGDIKQIINPTFFNLGRIKKLFNIQEKSIYVLHSNFRNSKVVTKLINEVNKIRNKKLPSLHQEDMIMEDSKNSSPGNVYSYSGNKKELIDFISGANSAIIVDEKELKEIEGKGIDTFNFYTVEQSKGMEFENVCVLNILSNKKDIFDTIWNNTKIKDMSLHYNFNLFYVAITRAKFNLIIVEDTSLDMYKYLLDSINEIDKISDIGEIDLTDDESAIGYYNQGLKLLDERNLYDKAKKYFNKALLASKLEEEKLLIKNKIKVCDIYINTNNFDIDLAKAFEENKIYDYSYKHYRALNDYNNMVMMALMNNNYELVNSISNKYNIDLNNLYGKNSIYDKVINKFLDSKIDTINKDTKDIKDFVNEANKLMKKIKFFN